MKRKLLLVLRHGKSDWTTGLEDFHRPLVGRGRKGARKMGAWIRHLDLIPDAVLSSPAARARATTEAACKTLGIPLDNVIWDERLYEAPGTQVLSVLAEAPKKAKRLLLVGHNPGLEELIHLLVGETPGRAAPTCSPSRGRAKSPTTKPPGSSRSTAPRSARCPSISSPNPPPSPGAESTATSNSCSSPRAAASAGSCPRASRNRI